MPNDCEAVSIADLLELNSGKSLEIESKEPKVITSGYAFQAPDIVPIDWSKVKTIKDIKSILSTIMVIEIDLNQFPDLRPFT